MKNEKNDSELVCLESMNSDIWDSFLENLYKSEWPRKLPHPILDNLFQTVSLRPKKFIAIKNKNTLSGISVTNIEKKISRAVTFLGIHRMNFSEPDSMKLIQSNITSLKKIHIQKMHVQTQKHDTQIQTILTKLGFKKIREYTNLMHDKNILQSVEIPKNLELHNLQIGEGGEITAILNKTFKNEWGFCPNTVKEIIHSMYSSGNNLEDIIILKNNNRFVSFNWTELLEKNVGKIGMLGVHPKFQNLGIGKITALLGMKYLKSKNIKIITLEVDNINLPAIKLYTDLGFKKYFSTIWFEKIL